MVSHINYQQALHIPLGAFVRIVGGEHCDRRGHVKDLGRGGSQLLVEDLDGKFWVASRDVQAVRDGQDPQLYQPDLGPWRTRGPVQTNDFVTVTKGFFSGSEGTVIRVRSDEDSVVISRTQAITDSFPETIPDVSRP